jgi:hypothetical protein
LGETGILSSLNGSELFSQRAGLDMLLDMSEENSSWHQIRGYSKLETAELRLWLYQLNCIFFASPKLSGWADDDDWRRDPFLQMLQDFEEHEVLKLILRTSIWCRALEENLPLEERKKFAAYPIGELQQDKSSKTKVPLTFREACNKIIHATYINFDRKRSRSLCYNSLKPFFYIYGKKGQKEWRAKFDLKEFTISAWHLASSF